MICPNCYDSVKLKKTEKFCKLCGQDLTMYIKGEVECVSCGKTTKLGNGDKFCNHCGDTLREHDNKAVEGEKMKLLQVFDDITEDPSIKDEQKIKLIIHATSVVCAFVAIQPIPMADLFILTPIQVLMVSYLGKVIGNKMTLFESKEVAVSLLGVVGWGVLAQQVILGLYKTVVPYLGGFTTIPLVYGATYGLGFAAKTVLEARKNSKVVKKEEIIKIQGEEKEKAKAEFRNVDSDKLENMYKSLFERKFGNYKRSLEQKSSSILRLSTQINQKDVEIEKLSKQQTEIEQKLQYTINKSTNDSVLTANFIKQITELQRQIESLKEKELDKTTSIQDELRMHEEIEILKNKLKESIPSREVDEILRENLVLIENNKEKESVKKDLAKTRYQLDKLYLSKEDEIRARFRRCYNNVLFREDVFKYLAKMENKQFTAFEQQVGLLQHSPEKANSRCLIKGKVTEYGFDGTGRFYLKKDGGSAEIVRVGDKNSQDMDIRWVKENY